ncbi:9972_t:CDS:2, partial [Funneliformis geosporum]
VRMYGVFHKQYNILVDDTNWITNSNQAGKNKLMDSYAKIFIKSNFEARMKGKKGKVNITKFTPNTEMSISKMGATAEKYALQVKDLTNILTPLHKEISHLELQWMDFGRKVRRAAWDPGSANYQKLKEIRHEIVTKRFKAIKLEKALAKARSSLYSLNKTLRTANFACTTSSENANPPDKTKKNS